MILEAYTKIFSKFANGIPGNINNSQFPSGLASLQISQELSPSSDFPNNNNQLFPNKKENDQKIGDKNNNNNDNKPDNQNQAITSDTSHKNVENTNNQIEVINKNNDEAKPITDGQWRMIEAESNTKEEINIVKNIDTAEKKEKDNQSEPITAATIANPAPARQNSSAITSNSNTNKEKCDQVLESVSEVLHSLKLTEEPEQKQKQQPITELKMDPQSSAKIQNPQPSTSNSSNNQSQNQNEQKTTNNKEQTKEKEPVVSSARSTDANSEISSTPVGASSVNPNQNQSQTQSSTNVPTTHNSNNSTTITTPTTSSAVAKGGMWANIAKKPAKQSEPKTLAAKMKPKEGYFLGFGKREIWFFCLT